MLQPPQSNRNCWHGLAPAGTPRLKKLVPVAFWAKSYGNTPGPLRCQRLDFDLGFFAAAVGQGSSEPTLRISGSRYPPESEPLVPGEPICGQASAMGRSDYDRGRLNPLYGSGPNGG